MMARKTLCNKATARRNTAPYRCVLMAMAASACLQLTAVELITNGGFEACEEGCTPPAQCQNLSDSLRLTGWTWGGNVGMTKSYSSCPWLRVGTLNGDYALYFQKNSSITQTIDVVDAGAYVASFGYIARADNTCYAKGRFYVEIDGVEIGHADCGTERSKFLLARFATNLSAGSHTFVIRHSNELSTDGEKRSNSVIDALSLQSVDRITNGGFEACEEGCTPPAQCQNLSDSLRLTGWTWGGNVGMTKSYSSCPWLRVGTLNGDYALYFQKNSSITQTIDVVDAGAYVASFGYIARADNTCYAKGRFYVEIDGVEIGHADCGTVRDKFRLARFTTNLSAGSHTFVIRHSNELSTDGEKRSNSIMDALSLLPASDIDTDNLLSNWSFEDFTGYTYTSAFMGFADGDGIDIEGWTADTAGTGLSKGGSAFLAGSPYDGSFVLLFNGDERSVSHPISVSAEGDYVVSFAYAARDTRYYYGGRIYAKIDGVSVGYVDCTAVGTYRRAMFRTHLAAGNHTFMLYHTDEADTEVGHVPCSTVDAVSVRPIDTLLINGSFDEGTVGSEGYSGSTDGVYSNPGWTTSGSCGIAKPGVPDNARLVSSDIDSGVYSMYILTANYTRNGTGGRQNPPVSISQSFTAPKAGIYELRFSYASRPYNGYRGGTIYARIYRGEGLEGEKVWERSVVATSLNAFQQFVGEAKLYSSGKYTLEFYAPQPEYIESGENNLNSVLDNVSLEYSRKIQGFMLIVR